MANSGFVLDVGLPFIVDGLLALGATEPHHVGMGTGGTAAVVGDTGLVTAVDSRVIGTTSKVTTTKTNDTYRIVATPAASTTRAVIEAAAYTDAAAGVCFIRVAHSVVNLENGDSIEYTFNVKMNQT
jgi:hypothetical protein